MQLFAYNFNMKNLKYVFFVETCDGKTDNIY